MYATPPEAQCPVWSLSVCGGSHQVQGSSPGLPGYRSISRPRSLGKTLTSTRSLGSAEWAPLTKSQASEWAAPFGISPRERGWSGWLREKENSLKKVLLPLQPPTCKLPKSSVGWQGLRLHHVESGQLGHQALRSPCCPITWPPGRRPLHNPVAGSSLPPPKATGVPLALTSPRNATHSSCELC